MYRIVGLLLATTLSAQEEIPLRVDVSLVPVTVSISDSNGKPLDDIRREEITLLDNGKPREIQFFGRDVNVPLTIGLIADMSGSQADWSEAHALHLKQFISQVLQPDDRAFLVMIGGDPRLVRDLTGSQDDLRAGVDLLAPKSSAGEPFGDPCPPFRLIPPRFCVSSPLWNGVYAATRLRMQERPGRKALIMLSDGVDNGSQHSLTETIEAAQSADTAVYGIHAGRRRGKANLERLAVETGGSFYSADGDLPAVFAKIEAELRSLYVLGFVVPAEARDGKFHKLEVKVSRPGVRVRAREGYTAERP